MLFRRRAPGFALSSARIRVLARSASKVSCDVSSNSHFVIVLITTTNVHSVSLSMFAAVVMISLCASGHRYKNLRAWLSSLYASVPLMFICFSHLARRDKSCAFTAAVMNVSFWPMGVSTHSAISRSKVVLVHLPCMCSVRYFVQDVFVGSRF